MVKWFLKITAAFSIWEMITRMLKIPSYLLPAPSEIGINIVQSAGILLKHAAVTGFEAIFGLMLGIAAGFGLGLAIHSSSLVRSNIYPVIIWMQSIPKMALAPLFVLWFGFGPASKIILVALIVTFPILVNTVKGLARTPSDVRDLCRILRFSRWRVLREVEIPFSLPFVFSGMKVASTLAVIAAIVGEYIGADAGLGYLLESSRFHLDTPRMFAVIFVLGFLGLGLFKSIEFLEMRALPWHLRTSSEDK